MKRRTGDLRAFVRIFIITCLMTQPLMILFKDYLRSILRSNDFKNDRLKKDMLQNLKEICYMYMYLETNDV